MLTFFCEGYEGINKKIEEINRISAAEDARSCGKLFTVCILVFLCVREKEGNRTRGSVSSGGRKSGIKVAPVRAHTHAV